MRHSRKHPYHPHRGNRKLTPLPPPDGRNFLCGGIMDLFWNDPNTNNGIPPGPDKGRIIHFTVNTLYSSYCKWDHAKCIAGIIFKTALKAIYNQMDLNDWIDTACRLYKSNLTTA